MFKEATLPAREALQEATTALKILEGIGPEPETLEAFGAGTGAWSCLLAFGNRVFTKLEQAAKVSPEARLWFATKKAARKSDPMLSYLQHARNADEHSLTKITYNDGGGVHVTVPQHLAGAGKPILHLDPAGGQNHTPAHPDIKITKTGPAKIVLQPAIDRGVTYAVPESHEGQPINSDLLTIATLFVHYLKNLVLESEKHV